MWKWLTSWWQSTSVDSITSKLNDTLVQLDDYQAQCEGRGNELAIELAKVNKEGDRASRIADKLRDILD